MVLFQDDNEPINVNGIIQKCNEYYYVRFENMEQQLKNNVIIRFTNLNRNSCLSNIATKLCDNVYVFENYTETHNDVNNFKIECYC